MAQKNKPQDSDPDLPARLRAAKQHNERLAENRANNPPPKEGEPGLFAKFLLAQDPPQRVNPNSNVIELFKALGGRQKDSGTVNSRNAKQVLNEIIKVGQEIFEYEHNVRIYDVAKKLAGTHGISLHDYMGDQKKEAARKAIHRAIKAYNPTWTWRDNIIPLIKSGKSL